MIASFATCLYGTPSCACVCALQIHCSRNCFSFGYYNFIPNLESCLSSHPFGVLIFCFSEKLIRLKQAKEEAEKEIAAYRAQLEREFQRKVAEVSYILLQPIHKNRRG